MGWGPTILVGATGSVLVCRKWPDSVLPMLPSNTKFTSRKDFQCQAPQGTGVLAAKEAQDATHR